MKSDLKSAWRSVRRWPAASIAIVAVMAVAIAGFGIAYSLFQSLRTSLPFEDPEGLVLLWYQQEGQSRSHLTLSAAELKKHRDQSGAFESIGGFRTRLLTCQQDGVGTQVVAAEATADIFEILGRQARIGRTFAVGEDTAGRSGVVVLSHAYWEQQFGASEDAIGEEIVLDGNPFTIVGVMPADFELFLPALQLFVPLVLEGDLPRQVRDTLAVGRLNPGATLATARAAARQVGRRLKVEAPDSNRDFEPKLDYVSSFFPNPAIRNLSRSLTAAVLIVLLIACANVANLMLSRGVRRRAETATRFALGASRTAVIRAVLLESLALSIAAGVVGTLIVFWWAGRVGSALGPLVTFAFNPEFDAGVLLAMGAVAASAGCLVGSLPALFAGRVDIIEGLQNRRGASVGAPGRWMRQGSVVAQIALTLVVLAGASVMVGGFEELRRVDPAMDADRVLLSMISVDRGDELTQEESTALYAGLLSTVERIPGIESAALASSLPRSPFGAIAPLDPGGFLDDSVLPVALWIAVTPGYADVLNLTLLSGRQLQHSDRSESAPVAVISRTTSERFWPGEEAVGRALSILGRRREIVGVVRDARQEFLTAEEGHLPVVYLPFSQTRPPGIHLLLRSGVDPDRLVPLIGAADLDSRLTLGPVSTLSSSVGQFFSGLAVASQLLTGFGFLALGLAAFGVFGLVSFGVSQRTHEIGVRVALGSGRRGIEALFVREGLWLWLIGVLMGVPGALAVHRLLSAAFFGVEPIRATGLITVIGVLLAATLLATWLPARRAAGVNPVDALRE